MTLGYKKQSNFVSQMPALNLKMVITTGIQKMEGLFIILGRVYLVQYCVSACAKMCI